MKSHLSWRDTLLALAVVLVWGSNFVVIRLGLNVLPPLLFASLRFLFVFAPAALFLPKPKTSWSNLALYGACIGLQFAFLFIAMKGRISPGLASLVVQMQAFFTVGLAVWRNGEKIKLHQMAAFVVAIAGMGLIGTHNGEGATIAGVALTLLAAMSWALGNQASREAGQVKMLAYVVWAALFAVPPLLALSLVMEGPAAIAAGVGHAGWVTWAAVLWQSAGNTMFGYACWAWLLSRYPAATVAPMSLLVPIVGFASSAILLAEPLPLWKIGATLLIMVGLAMNLLWARRGQQKTDETVRWTVSSGESRELGRAAGGAGDSAVGGEPL